MYQISYIIHHMAWSENGVTPPSGNFNGDNHNK